MRATPEALASHASLVNPLLRVSTCDEHGVHAAKGERVGHHGVTTEWTRLVRHVVEAAPWIGNVEVCGRWRDAAHERVDRGDHLDRAGGAHEMAMERLRR